MALDVPFPAWTLCGRWDRKKAGNNPQCSPFVTPGGKGLLETEKRGKLRSYTAAMTREAYKNSETRDFLAQLYGGSIQNMVACMADGGGISPEELEALRAWLKERDPQ